MSSRRGAGQSRGLDQTLAKAEAKLTTIAQTLATGRGRRTRTQLEAAVDKITGKRWVRDVLSVTVTGESPATLRLHWRIDPTARDQLENRIFGKRILITDRRHPTVPEIIAGYRSQSDAEFGFRQLKDPDVVSFSPMHHWTEAHIGGARGLLRARPDRGAPDAPPRRPPRPRPVRTRPTRHPGRHRRTVLIYPGDRGRPKARRMLTDTDPTQRQLYDIFELTRWTPSR